MSREYVGTEIISNKFNQPTLESKAPTHNEQTIADSKVFGLREL
ncbi:MULTISPECIES: hypothetical protein [Helicobacter]|uniref:Uncharacterized protein n=1 Tax=Helicobacter mastomyrinus TaxID=287948 RepID=A0ABZ3F4A0_9HELI|nr:MULTISPECIES: hypothetical protein [Helicobacter]